MADFLQQADERLTHLELFFGALDNALARVYARLPRGGLPDEVRLVGQITGPDCAWATTLPDVIRFRDAGPGETLLSWAAVPDPCCWTTELPFYYRVRIELRQGAALLAQTERLFAFRRLGAAGSSLRFEGARFVVRAVEMQRAFKIDLKPWRAADAACWAVRPDDELCEQASMFGVLLIAEIPVGESTLRDDLSRLARWPAVGIVVLEAQEISPRVLERRANLLLAQQIDRAAAPAVSIAPWADLLVVDANHPHLPDLARGPLPVLVRRSVPRPTSVAAARGECDRLQRELAPLADFAGYIV
ncbi:MAG TPA: hypothetical protein VFE24_18520 [Pirellulales bacterium]|jgi:hypothetical protein|nr:hypothetical protein [Pirellulales bacterium]